MITLIVAESTHLSLALAVEGEHVLPPPGLALPDEKHPVAVGALMQHSRRCDAPAHHPVVPGVVVQNHHINGCKSNVTFFLFGSNYCGNWFRIQATNLKYLRTYQGVVVQNYHINSCTSNVTFVILFTTSIAAQVTLLLLYYLPHQWLHK